METDVTATDIASLPASAALKDSVRELLTLIRFGRMLGGGTSEPVVDPLMALVNAPMGTLGHAIASRLTTPRPLTRRDFLAACPPIRGDIRVFMQHLARTP